MVVSPPPSLGVLILRDVPVNTEVGIDLKSWNVGPKFMGLKDIPLGIHFVYFSSVDKSMMSGLRVGFFHVFDKPGFAVYRWNPLEEDFISVALSDDDYERILSSYDEISPCLGPYPKDSYLNWVSISNFLDKATLSIVMPSCGRLYSCPQFISEASTSQQRLALNQPSRSVHSYSQCTEEELLPKMNVCLETVPRFTPIPNKPLYPVNSSPSDITHYGMDRSFTLESVLENISKIYCNKKLKRFGSELLMEEASILAELQFSFIAFFLGQLLDGWTHWRQLIFLLSNCEAIIRLHPQLYSALISVLYHQITLTSSDDSTDPQDPESLSAVDLSNLFFEAASDVHFKARTSDCGPSFLATCMRRLIANILAADSAAKIDEGLSTSLAISSGSKMASKSNQLADLANRAVGFQCSLERRFGCSLEPEKQGCLSKTSDVSGELLVSEVDWDSEDAPVIVNE